MAAGGGGGLIVASARGQDPVLDELAEAAVPTVLVNRRNESGPFPYIGTDDRHGIEMCVNHLRELGHRTILHLAGPADTSTGRDRAGGFRQAMRGNELPISQAILPCPSVTERAAADAVTAALPQG